MPDGGVEERLVDVGNGLRLFARVHRSGTRGAAPLLLLHGFTASMDSWRHLVASLAPHLDMVTVDLPGHGGSTIPPDPSRYALEAFADDLARVLDALGIRTAIVLGYSMGGRAALKFVLRHPSRVRALVLESTSPGISDPAQRSDRWNADLRLAEMLERDGITPFVDYWERLPLWSSQAGLEEGTRAALRAQRLAQSAVGLANSLRGAGQGVDADVVLRIGDIRVPVLLLAGALDSPYVSFARSMASSIRDARLEIVPAAGHAVHLERPVEYAALVKSFVMGNSFIQPGDAAGIHQENE